MGAFFGVVIQKCLFFLKLIIFNGIFEFICEKPTQIAFPRLFRTVLLRAARRYVWPVAVCCGCLCRLSRQSRNFSANTETERFWEILQQNMQEQNFLAWKERNWFDICIIFFRESIFCSHFQIFNLILDIFIFSFVCE